MIQDLTPLTRPIIDIYDEMELDLIEEIARRFDANDTVGGSREWQEKKLDEMGMLNADAVKVIAKQSKKTETEIRKMLLEAGFANVDKQMLDTAFRAGAIAVDPSVILESVVLRSTLEDSYKELSQAYKMIQTKALESVKSAYMDVINRSYVEVSAGIYDYNTAIKRALTRMADNGITGATYQRQSGQIVRYSIEAAVRRDTLTAVHQTANRYSHRLTGELGVEYVEVSSHAGARVSKTSHIANHAWWQGKVYKLEGFDEEYGNLKANTGYPDDIEGLGGVNCRHRMYPYIPGVTKRQAEEYDEEKAEREYKANQQLRAKERRIRSLKKRIVALNAVGEPTTELGARLKDAYADAQKFAKDNGLAYDWNRTQVTPEAAGDRTADKAIRASMKQPKPISLIEEKSLRTRYSSREHGVKWGEVKSKRYTERFDRLSDNEKANQLAAKRCRNALSNRDGKNTEELYAISLTTGKDVAKVTDQNQAFAVRRDEKFMLDVKRAEEKGEKVLLIHNHPAGSPPSRVDINELLRHERAVGMVAGHDGSLYYYTRPSRKITEFDFTVAFRKVKGYNDKARHEKAMEELSKQFGFDFVII